MEHNPLNEPSRKEVAVGDSIQEINAYHSIDHQPQPAAKKQSTSNSSSMIAANESINNRL